MKTVLAKLDENNVVINVINGDESIISKLPGNFNWVVSFKPESFEEEKQGADLKYNPAGIGDTYDAVNGAFIKQQPYASWSLDSNYRWQAPVAKPSDDIENGGDIYYTWDEENTAWEVR